MAKRKRGLLLVLFCPFFLKANLSTVGELDDLQSQTTYYRALLARNKAKEEVELTSLTQSASEPHSKGVSLSTGIAKITKIMGNGKNLSVRLRFPDGSEMTRKKGDALPGGFRLTDISLNEVRVTNVAGKKIMLMEVTQ